MRPQLGTACVMALALLAASCGGGKNATTTAPAATHPQQAKAPSVCLPAARAKVASFLGHPPAAIVTKQGTGNNGMPQCSFRAGRVDLTANVDTAPQAYFRLERTVVEETQQFSTTREVAPAQRIAKLGLDADWFPAEQQLMTTDGKQLLTVTVKWPDSTHARQRALAKAVARAYLAGGRNTGG